MRRHIGLAANLFLAVMACAGVSLGAVTSDANTAWVPSPHTESPADQVAHLMESHHCWAGEAPKAMAGVIPGHAVVTLPGRAPAYVNSQVGFDIWLDGKPGQLHGFCR